MSDKYQIDPNKIDKLANLAIKVGLGLQKGQNLIITAPIESLPLVRKIKKCKKLNNVNKNNSIII